MEAEQKKEEEESGEELLRAEEIEKSIRKNFTKDCSRDLPRQFGNMSWCRRGQDCSLYFRWKRFDADGKAVSGIKKAQQVSV